MRYISFAWLLLWSVRLTAQSSVVLPESFRAFPLKANQILSVVSGMTNCYQLTIYVDNGKISKKTRDSLATDSRQLLELLLEKVSAPCEMIQIDYRERYSSWNAGVTIRYGLENREIIRIDSFDNNLYGSNFYAPVCDYPIQANQYANWYQNYKSSYEKDRRSDHFNIYTILPPGPINKDSLEQEGIKVLQLFLENRYKRSKVRSALHIRYIHQYGGTEILTMTFPLNIPKRYQQYYYQRIHEGGIY